MDLQCHQKLPVSDFKWVEKEDILKVDEKFIENYDENSDIGYVLEVDVEYPKSLHKLHSDLPFLPERMKINKCTKLVNTVQDKENYAYKSFKISIRSWINIKKGTQSNRI